MNVVQLKSVHPKKGSPPEVQLQSASHCMATTTSLEKERYKKNTHTKDQFWIYEPDKAVGWRMAYNYYITETCALTVESLKLKLKRYY
jgi:hypothetical protein